MDKKPSEIIGKKAQEIHESGIDPYFNGNVPDICDWVNAILQYLDDLAKSKNKIKCGK